jgi:hypothetical protein
MTKKEKGKGHERMKEKTMGQPIAIKERKGGKMVTGRRGQHGQVGNTRRKTCIFNWSLRLKFH